jgi:glycosyltransferase involved in cell wall biosynthesis
MAAGVPIIATNVGGIPDLIDHDRSGWVIPAADSEALATGLGLLMSNRSLAKNLAKEAQIKANHFSPKAMAESYMQVY